MITIIIPTYNRAAIIPATLDSVANQVFTDWECIVVDDFSKDNTEDIIKQYVEKDGRFRYLKNERKKGAQGARNTGLLHSKSDWIIFFDSDNLMHPNFLQKLTDRIENNVDVVQCFSNVIDVNTKIHKNTFKWRSYGNIHEKLFTLQTYVDFNQAIIRKSKLIEIGGLDEDCPSMQEWDTHIRLSNTAQYTTVEEALLDYFVGAKDAISTDTKREVKGRLYILQKHLTEWKQQKSAYKKFIIQIVQYIERNSDKHFKKETYQYLKKIAPAFSFIITFEMIKRRLQSLYCKLKT